MAAVFGALLASTQSASAMQEYIAEPTEAFLDSEKQASDFKKKQTALKRKFQGFLDDLNGSTTDEEATDALVNMKKLVVDQQDLPAGYTKESLRKVMSIKRNSMTAKGLWATPVEIAFKGFMNTVTLVQSPNRMSLVE
mmetsp:Transcript_34479/g.68474  ORF Transcript_34479/g.68474 Transcript_34479/m.68474 type:complete len:138 (-) Transcript_34479:232-645(-)|eukprot:CAMPEP_0171620276 /NCGR_PEP_ID=MMETSP0990-20121206/15893_1 /TAXON_ID=483369 /ORGANISM="non described non described, Strain CCMP2098" /LENGTH=137 /DNA_ID=CAMNT_0012185535 /DNA_START=188 /DNA_END=601 /DNA_ORIENTATION=-